MRAFLFDFSAFKNKANWETGYFTYNYSSEGQEYKWIIRAFCYSLMSNGIFLQANIFMKLKSLKFKPD